MPSTLKVEVPSWPPQCHCHSLNLLPIARRLDLGKPPCATSACSVSRSRLPTVFVCFPLVRPSPCMEAFRPSVDCVLTTDFRITL